MSRYNTHSPCALGPEWFPTIEGSVRLDGDLVAAGTVLTSQVAETITDVWIALAYTSGDLTGFELEIYDASDLPGNQTVTDIFRPGDDALKVDSYGWDGSSLLTPTDTLYTLINEATLTPGTYNGRAVADADWISPIFGAGAQYGCRFASVAGSVANRNIVSVTLKANVAELIDRYLVEGGEIVAFVTIADQTFYGRPAQVVGSGSGFQPAQLISSTWWANPNTGVSWKPQDVDEFDASGGSSYAGWIIKPTGTSNNLTVIFQGWLEVTYLDETDKRVAVGALAPPDDRWGWQSMTITAPDGTADWSKANATDYLFLLRRRVGAGYVDWRYVADLTREPIDPAWQRVTPRLYRETFTLARTGADRRGQYAILLERSDTAMSIDSQPYRSISDDTAPTATHEWTNVNASEELQQDVTTVGSLDYGFARWLCRWENTRPDGDLTVGVYRRSDDVQMGTDIVISPDDLSPPRTGWQVMDGEFGPVTLAAATQYYVKFSSPATDGSGWRVQVMSTMLDTDPGGPPVAAYDQTFGGTTDVAWPDGVAVDALDACVTIHTQDDPVADLTAAEVQVADCLTYVSVTWTAAEEGDCGALVGYELDRYSTLVERWQRIAELAPDVTSFDDYEARRSGDVEYRIRTRRDDGSASPWAELAEPLERTPTCCGYVIASNEAPEYALWYDDVVGPDGRRLSFPDQRSLLTFYGRDFAVGFGGLEQGGDEFTIDVLVASDGGVNGTPEVTTHGPEAFWPLRWLVGSMKIPAVGTKLAVSYLAVLDSFGSQWFAEVQIVAATFNERVGSYEATLRVRQVTDTPSVIIDAGGA